MIAVSVLGLMCDALRAEIAMLRKERDRRTQFMKRLSLWLLVLVLWPATARATLFSYNIDVTFPAASLSTSIFGDVQVGVFFPQETSIDFPMTAFFLPDLPREAWPWFSINGDQLGGFWYLAAISPTDYQFWIGDAGGNVYVDLLYDEIQSPSAPFREPDAVKVSFGHEAVGIQCCPLILGASGTQTFTQGEFNFDRQHYPVAEPASLALLACGLWFILRRRNKFEYIA